MPLGGWLALVAFLAGIGGALYLWGHEVQNSVSIPVPARDLPAYQQIQPGDLAQQAFFPRHLPSVTLEETAQIVGHYTLVNVPHQQPLSYDQLGPVVDTDLISGTVAIGIPATPAMLLGGSLKAGDIVDIFFIPSATETQPSPRPTLLENILVLDIKPGRESDKVEDVESSQLFVVIVAVPLDQRTEFAIRSASGTLTLTRKN